jgi:hypothetical protein
MTDKESAKEKLLEASGLQQSDASSRERVEQMERLFRSMMSELKEERAEAERSHDQGENLLRNLERYCNQLLPQQMLKAFEQVADSAVRNSLAPLDGGIHKTVSQLEEYLTVLRKISWYWLRDIAISALVMGLVVGGMVRWVFLADQLGETRRYAVWGRKVEQRIETAPPKTREQFYRWIGGRP